MSTRSCRTRTDDVSRSQRSEILAPRGRCSGHGDRPCSPRLDRASVAAGLVGRVGGDPRRPGPGPARTRRARGPRGSVAAGALGAHGRHAVRARPRLADAGRRCRPARRGRAAGPRADVPAGPRGGRGAGGARRGVRPCPGRYSCSSSTSSGRERVARSTSRPDIPSTTAMHTAVTTSEAVDARTMTRSYARAPGCGAAEVAAAPRGPGREDGALVGRTPSPLTCRVRAVAPVRLRPRGTRALACMTACRLPRRAAGRPRPSFAGP